MFKKFNQYITEEFFFTPKVTSNYANQQTSLKQAYPDADDADDNDDYNPSIINKNAEEGPNGDVAFVSKHDKTKGGEIDTFSNRTKPEGPNGQSILSQSGVAENKEEPKQGRWYIHKKSGQTWQLNWLDTEDNEAVMVKSGGRPLTKRIKLKNFNKNWEPKILGEGGLGDNEVAGQRVYTQTVDTSKQGYQDSMYYGDEDVDSHGEECDCPYCIEKYS